MACTLEFLVTVGEPQLLRPETSCPREFKYLSNIDDQIGLRNHIPFVHFYPPSKVMNDTNSSGNSNSNRSKNIVDVIRMGVSKALVHYYPIAGKLRNGEKGKLAVDCCGEGVIFREADANVTLEELQRITNNGGLKPPFPQWEKLLVDDVWGCNFITDSPLLRMQVTRLACRGFVLAYTFNHCVCDAYGALQFVTAVSEFARNFNRNAPNTIPSWGRELLKPRNPPIISYPHPEYDLDYSPDAPLSDEPDFKRLEQTSVFFSKFDVSALKRKINDDKCATFDVIAACLWRARTKTIIHPETVTKLLFPVDTRFRYKPELPPGYYGSAVVFPRAATKAKTLVSEPLRYAAGLISEVKKGVVGDEYRMSVLDLIEGNGRRGFCRESAFVVSDMSRLRFAEVDFGWGPAVYGGPARAGTGHVPGMVTSVIGHKDGERGVEGLLALVSLPSHALELFHEEVRREISGYDHGVIVASAL
ncbi:hypothetical protein Scep_022959 [Stephania cephalantha]|uniref:Benzyl alcohol O-benzoyltransferase n=1 Tax=Stephania cephalantha TaxID=152367 RepID=A0AAP0F8W2_9MAGN